ncbi:MULTISPECIES: NAD-dependent epimerase/dehydratase family protein [Burkholderia cepacia complex]|uniref:NAD-dependent epimerase/dehydratase family protein n=1 Tax=Burkholderia cepacia complex TaxID=87882 RepID=UPI000754343D|nr:MULTISPECIES: NAD-dependent epimerase/dehydratase family protein [Burkholderia cepacia complex]KVS34271.1 cinnamyl alcohol dehydrogenase [Burkholderia cepacia]MBR8282552.1 NAD-dependent epimerase/dehydratase family protein [Burkholderia vietnamiensis]MCA8119095.1 NAD-dependent epimerase/dehydratase family protein [Burkholderia cepacia]MDN8076400.1 NAD-dependent epimerase/dehydratase family protein [Burkholderia vietnamiensis]HDR8986777.1 NAD-dependent epimerase/dehydratase family protein [B
MTSTNQPVAVTGGSGFVACHLVQLLLSRGFVVHATIRKLNRSIKLQPLLDMQKQYPGQLNLFEADLLKPGSFDRAFDRCSVVYHVASPFLLPEKITDGARQLLAPALEGTRNVLGSVNRTPSVERVVLTSTIGAIFGDYIDVMRMKDQTLSDAYFNTSSSLDNNPYHFSKVEAEREAWRIFKSQNRWTMVAINPGMVLGPSLTPASDSGSLFLLDEMLKGYFFYGVPDLSLATVDVREVAQAHLNAALNPSATGRYILADRQMISFLEIAKILRRVHARPFLLPRNQIPLLLVKLIGPFFGLDQQYIRNHVGIRFPLDNTRSISELGISYRPIQDTLTDHYRSWAEHRLALAEYAA